MRQPNAKADRILAGALPLLLGLFLGVAPATKATDLGRATQAAFDRYTQLTETSFDTENKNLSQFLWIDQLPTDQRKKVYEELHSGQVVIEHLQTQDVGKPIAVPGGMIHHWIGTVFIPGATLTQVLAFEQDYNAEPKYFSPNVQASKILVHSGSDFTVEIRFHEKQVITVVLETAHQIHYERLNASQAWSRSWTTRVQQVDNPGQPNERLEPEGRDDGFLWRMNTYWRFEEKDGGVYLESQSVSLTRDIPTGLGWAVGPFVTSIPRESLNFTLTATRNAIAAKNIHK